MKYFFCLIAILFLVLTGCKDVNKDFSPISSSSNLSLNYSKIPIHFEANQNALNNEVKFISRSNNFQLYLSPDKALFEFRNSEKENNSLVLKFIGANKKTTISGKSKLKGKSNYLFGSKSDNWKTGIDHYKKVHYSQIYNGIDLEFYESSSGKMEFDFIVNAGANPNDIRIGIDKGR